MKALSITGGGVRGMAVAGAIQALESTGWRASDCAIITGDSFGALCAALLANGWSGKRMADLFCQVPLQALTSGLLPWGWRKRLAIARPVRLAHIAAYLDALNLRMRPGLVINTWDAEDNRQVLHAMYRPGRTLEDGPVDTDWDTQSHRTISLGTLLTRSMALPGLLADSPRWMDGGLGEHPPLSFLPDECDLTVISLGYAGLVPRNGDTTPRGILDRALYAYEVTAATRQRQALSRFHSVTEYSLPIYDVDPTDFGLSSRERLELIDRGRLAVLSALTG